MINSVYIPLLEILLLKTPKTQDNGFLEILSKKRLRQILCTSVFTGPSTRKTLTIWRVTSFLSVAGKAEGGATLCSLGSSDRTHGSGSKLHQGRFRLVSGSLSMLRGWPNSGTGFLEGWLMPQACLCLRHLDKICSNMLYPQISPELVRQWKLVISGLFRLRYSFLIYIIDCFRQ